MNMKNRPMIMIDGQIIVALAAAFLLGIVFGSGLEILVRNGATNSESRPAAESNTSGPETAARADAAAQVF